MIGQCNHWLPDVRDTSRCTQLRISAWLATIAKQKFGRWSTISCQICYNPNTNCSTRLNKRQKTPKVKFFISCHLWQELTSAGWPCLVGWRLLFTRVLFYWMKLAVGLLWKVPPSSPGQLSVLWSWQLWLGIIWAVFSVAVVQTQVPTI